MVKRLKELRISAGISQQQLATHLGVSQQSVNKYENHNIEPDISVLIKMAALFNSSVDYLVGYSDVNCPLGNYAYSELSEGERRLLDGYKKLSDTEKKCVSTVIDAFNKQK